MIPASPSPVLVAQIKAAVKEVLFVCACVCVRARARVCECVFGREEERERESEGERGEGEEGGIERGKGNTDRDRHTDRLTG